MQIAKITELGPAEAHRGLKEMIDGQETMATRAGYLEPRSTRHRPLFSNPLPSLFSLAFSLTGAFSVYRSTSHPRRLCFHFNLHTADHVFRSDSPSSCYPRHASRPSIKPRLFLPPLPSRNITPSTKRFSWSLAVPCNADDASLCPLSDQDPVNEDCSFYRWRCYSTKVSLAGGWGSYSRRKK